MKIGWLNAIGKYTGLFAKKSHKRPPMTRNIVIHEHKFIYFPIPKVASSSIKVVCADLLGIEQDAFGQRRLSGIYVRTDPDVPHFFHRYAHRHFTFGTKLSSGFGI